MPFTRFFWLLMLISLVAGCASFEPAAPVSSQEPDTPISDEATATTLSPLERKAANLKAQPNRYLLNPASVDEQIQKVFAKGVIARESGDIEQAKRVFFLLTEQAPQLSGPWVQLGDLALVGIDANDISEQANIARDEAFTHYSQAVSVNPNNYHALNRMALMLRDKGQFEQARYHYQQAIDSWPGFALGYLNLGILHDLYLGNKHLALKHYETFQLLQDEPDRKVRGWIADLSRQIKQSNRQKREQSPGDSQ